MGDIFAIYEALWRRAKNEGAFVHYGGLQRWGEAGYFNDRQDSRRRVQRSPEILIYRPYYRSDAMPSRHCIEGQPDPDLRAELATLAHEYGHFASYSGRTPRPDWDVYKQTAIDRNEVEEELAAPLRDKGLTPTEFHDRVRTGLALRLGNDGIDRIVGEETLAWVIGREVLVEYGADDEYLDFYDNRTRIGLHNHRYRLNRDDLWPEDIPTSGT
jgi:hypothetical protein